MPDRSLITRRPPLTQKRDLNLLPVAVDLYRFISAQEVHHNHDERDDENQVNKASGDVQRQAEAPADEKDDSNKGEHNFL